MFVHKHIWSKITGGLVLGMGVFLGSGDSLVQTVQAQVVASSSAAVSVVNLDISPWIGVNCTDNVTVPSIVGFGNSTAPATCNIKTNSPHGYEVTISDMSDLVLSGQNPLTAAPNQKFIPAATQMSADNIGAWALSNNSGSSWLQTGNQVSVVGAPTPTQGNDLGMTVGVRAGAAPGLAAFMSAGNYAGTFTLTITSLP